MTTFTDRLALIIGVDNVQALAGLKAVSGATHTELSKAEQAAGQAGTRTGSAYGGAVKSSALLAVGTFAALGAEKFLSSSVAAAVDAARAQAQLQAVLKSTGGEAGVTAEGVEKLSSSLGKSAAIQDDVVKRGAALLLTFRAVHNEAGAGNDIFNRGVTAATDLSAALGQDLQSSVIQLGKALNDPVAGMTALRRVGISFTAEQKDQIKALAQSGNLLGAQKLILKEVEAEFGGTAAAIARADPFQRLAVSVHNFKETVGKDAVPALNAIVDVGTKVLGVFEHIPEPARGLTEALIGVGLVALPLLKVKETLSGIRLALAAVSGTTVVAPTVAAAAVTGAGAGVSTAAATAEEELAIASNNAAAAKARLTVVTAQATGAGVANADVDQAQAAAALEAAAADDALAAALERVAFASGSAAIGGSGVAGAAGAAAVSSKVAGGSVGEFAAGLGGLAKGATVAGAALLVTRTIVEHFSSSGKASSKDINDLTLSLGNLAKTGTVDTELTKRFGPGFEKLAKDVREVQDWSKDPSTAQAVAGAFNRGTSTVLGFTDQTEQAKNRVNNLDKALVDLLAVNPKAAAESFGQITRALEAQGVPAQAVKGLFDDYTRALHLADLAQQSTAGSAGDLATRFNAILTANFSDRVTSIGIADDFATAKQAVDGLNEAKLDAVGYGQKSKDAAKAEADAQRGLSDAYRAVGDAKDRVKDATDRLADAQDKLNKYNSAQSEHERALELDIIKRRVVKTPVEADQKTLDLLRFDESNADKSKSLNKAVDDAQKGLVDANRGVSDATRRVADAHDKVGEAAAKSRQIQVDAAAEVNSATRKAESAILAVGKAINDAAPDLANDVLKTYIGLLDALSQTLDPNGALAKNLDGFFKTITKPPPKPPNPLDFQHDPFGLNSPKTAVAPARPGPFKPDPTGDALRFIASLEHHATGGVVGGLPGLPRLIVAHGGERVLTAGQQGTSLHLEPHYELRGSTYDELRKDFEFHRRTLIHEVALAGRR